MKELTLLGKGPSSAECPFVTNETWATISCMESINGHKIERTFAFDTSKSQIIQKNLKIALDKGIPIWGNWEYCTNRFPLLDIAERFESTFFRNTMSYMIALALYEGYERLWIYGIDQGPEETYVKSRPQIAYWIGRAEGMGVKVKTPTLEWLRG